MRWRFRRTVSLVLAAALLVMLGVPSASAAGITMDNDVAPSSPNVYHVGDTITYKHTVRNGEAIPMWVDLEYTLPNGASGYHAEGQKLESGEERVYYVDYIVRAADVTRRDGRHIVDCVLTGVGTDGDGDGTGFSLWKSSTIIMPALDVKTTSDFGADGTYTDNESNYAGLNAPWRITITNTGNDTLTDVTVADSNQHSYGAAFSLTPGQERVFTYDQTISSPFTLRVDASGTDSLGSNVSDADCADVDPWVTSVKVDAAVEFDGDGAASDHETGFINTDATWQFMVHNDGEVPLTNVVVSDTNGHVFAPLELAPGESKTLSYSGNITSPTVDTAAVTALDPRGIDVEGEGDSASVDLHHPGVQLQMTASPPVVIAGEPIVYTYRVVNTGDVTLHDIGVIDNQIGPIGTIGSLAPGEATEMTTTTAISADTVSAGTATGYYDVPGEEAPRTEASSDEVDVDVVHPLVKIEASNDATSAGVLEGTLVVFSYTVTNTGDTTLFDLAVNDNVFGEVGLIASLAPGASSTVTTSSIVSADLTHVGSVAGVDAWDHCAADSDDDAVETFPALPDLAIAKSSSVATALPSDVVTYTLSLRNVGLASVQGFSVVDDFDERYVDVVDAAGGVVENGTITWMFDGDLPPSQTPQSIVYTVRLKSETELPAGNTLVNNVAVINSEGDLNPSNDNTGATVIVENPFLPFDDDDDGDEEPRSNTSTGAADDFLPFTGGELWYLAVAAAVCAALGLTLKGLGDEG